MKKKNDAYERGSPVGELEWKLLTTFGDGERITESLLSGGTVFLVRPSNPVLLTTFTGDEKSELEEMKHFHLIRISTAKVGSLSLRGLETVRTHVKNICSKMRVRNRVEVVAKYMSADGRNQRRLG